MQSAKITSYRSLALQAGVSRWQVQQLRQGNIAQMRWATLEQLAQALKISTSDLLCRFHLLDSQPQTIQPQTIQPQTIQPQTIQPQAELVQQAEAALQQAALETLETWLTNWPTIAKKAEENPTLSAAKIIKFVDPVVRLVESWGVEKIAPVGECVPYDPTRHDLMAGTASPGDSVLVRFSGYTHGGRLVRRAQVSPVANS